MGSLRPIASQEAQMVFLSELMVNQFLMRWRNKISSEICFTFFKELIADWFSIVPPKMRLFCNMEFKLLLQLVRSSMSYVNSGGFSKKSTIGWNEILLIPRAWTLIRLPKLCVLAFKVNWTSILDLWRFLIVKNKDTPKKIRSIFWILGSYIFGYKNQWKEWNG